MTAHPSPLGDGLPRFPEVPAGPVEALREIAFWRERARVDTHRVAAYRKAADVVAHLPAERRHELGDQARAWTRVAGIGPSTSAAIAQAMAGRVPEALAAARSSAQPVLDPSDEAGRALAQKLRGDLHTHTDASDGSVPIREMAATAQALGRSYIAITDHSPRLRVANGLSPERLRAQVASIQQLNAEFAREGTDFRVLTGIEVDILPDGSLDQEPDLLDQLDVVVASVHSELRMESAAMTRRMVTAIANPQVDVLGHCTGRKVEGARTRPPSTFEAEVVFEACRAFGTAVEINARPERADPPEELLALASEVGCLFAIDSDSHAPGQMSWLALGAARAARVGIDPANVVTTWPRHQLLDWTQNHTGE